MTAIEKRIAIMKNAVVTACLLVSIASAASAQKPSTKGVKPGKAELETRIITPANVERSLRILAHDSMEGRQVGSPGAARAAAFIAAEMKRIGLKPAGDNGTYFQNVTGSTRYTWAPTSTFTVDGKPLRWNVDVTVTAGAAVAPKPLANVQAIFGGIENDTVMTITAEQAAGKLVVLLPAPPRVAGAAPAARPAPGAPPIPRPITSAQKFSGAVAIARVNLDGLSPKWVKLINEPERASSPRGRAGAPPAAPVPATPVVRLTSSGAAAIFGKPLASLTPGATGGMVTTEITVKSEPQPTWTRNVIGILPGSDDKLKDEWILIDAHYDHVGRSAPTNSNRDSVFNGADDDASGTVAVLEIARALKAGPAPKRSVIFAAMTGEEAGLIGTNFYIANPYVPMTKVVANMEIEMIGRPDSLSEGVGGAWLTGYERSTMGPTLAAAGIRLFPDKRPSQNFFSRSDNRAFACMGIPAHTLSSFNLHTDYHQLSDDADKVDFAHMTEVIRSGAKAARILTDEAAPKWVEGGTPVGTSVCPGTTRAPGQ